MYISFIKPSLNKNIPGDGINLKTETDTVMTSTAQKDFSCVQDIWLIFNIKCKYFSTNQLPMDSECRIERSISLYVI